MGRRRHLNESYSGSSSYIALERLLHDRSRTVRIVSPYISGYYASRLAGIARKKDVYLITTARTVRDEKILRRHLSRGSASVLGRAMIAMAAGIAVSALAGLWVMVLIIAQLAAADAAFIAVSALGRRSRMHVRFAKGAFVHEKLYISDLQAMTGSANLTYSGMHRNVEHIELTRDPARVKELRSHFDELWRKAVQPT